jgi:hypothetical protein
MIKDQNLRQIKKVPFLKDTFKNIVKRCYPLSFISEVTESFFLPFALREARTLLPLAVDILSLKPCLLILFFLDG